MKINPMNTWRFGELVGEEGHRDHLYIEAPHTDGTLKHKP